MTSHAAQIETQLGEHESLELLPTPCITCDSVDYDILYPAKFSPEDFSPFGFSARRSRPVTHYELGKCCQCGLIRSTHIIPEERAQELYALSEYLYSDVSDVAAMSYYRMFSQLAHHWGENREISILEVGCGDGGFLNQIYQHGYKNVVGVEPSTEAIKNAPVAIRDKIRPEIFSAENLAGEAYDLIISTHVLDHLYRPDRFFEDAYAMLKPGGKLLTVCHDVSAWSAKLLGEKSPIFDIEHVYLFDIATLSKLYQLKGFTVADKGQLKNTYPFGYWLRMVPFAARLCSWIPQKILDIPLAIKAGNLFMLGEKPR